MIDFNTITNDIAPKLKKGIQKYNQLYRCEEDKVYFTNGFWLLEIETNIPTERKNKTFEKTNIESNVRFPNVCSVIKKPTGESTFNPLILDALKNYKTNGLFLSCDGKLHTKDTTPKQGRLLNLRVLQECFANVKKLKLTIESVDHIDNDLLVLNCGENVKAYIGTIDAQHIGQHD